MINDIAKDLLREIKIKSPKKRDDLVRQLGVLWLQGGGTLEVADDFGKTHKITLDMSHFFEEKQTSENVKVADFEKNMSFETCMFLGAMRIIGEKIKAEREKGAEK